jgi:hypothetical protein
MCLFTSARTAAIVFARSAGSEAMYCAGVLTFDGGFMDSPSFRTKCITERLKTRLTGRFGLGEIRREVNGIRACNLAEFGKMFGYKASGSAPMSLTQAAYDSQTGH